MVYDVRIKNKNEIVKCAVEAEFIFCLDFYFFSYFRNFSDCIHGKNGAVARQRCRIAGNVHHARRTLFRGRQCLSERLSAFARRIDEHAIDSSHLLPQSVPVLRRPGKEIAGDKIRLLSQTVGGSAGASAFHQCFIY